MTNLPHTDGMASEREMLVRFCTRYTGDIHSAEDLAQQALLQAWQHQHQLKEPNARRAWLLSIARNECRMWARSSGREPVHVVALDRMETLEIQRFAENYDPDQEIDRDDLTYLVQRALRLLPSDMQEVLVQRYAEDLPQAKVASRLGITEGAVEQRLHRGKRALRRILTAEFGAEAISHGLITEADAGWEVTRIWCPNCSRSYLEGRLNPVEGKLHMRCTVCASSDAHFIHARLGNALKNLKSYRPAVARVLHTIHDLFRLRSKDGAGPCPRCGQLLPIERGTPPWVPPRFADPASIYIFCAACGVGDSETWHSLTWSLPPARTFWREHPRMQFIPAREVEFAGSPAVVTGFENLSGSMRLEVVTLQATLEVVRINGEPYVELPGND